MDGQILITNLSTEDEEDAKPLVKVTWVCRPKIHTFRHKTILGICNYALRKFKQR
jgi:hypothetical protein